MKKNKIIYLLLILSLFYSCNRTKTDYDVIIVGGGLAGLAAAKELNTDKVLVLEKDSVLGGRVRTHYFKDIAIDLGADYVLNISLIEKLGIKDKIIQQEEDIAYYFDGKLYSGKNPYDCLKKISFINQYYLDSLYKNQYFYPKLIDSILYEYLNTNIESVFPCSLIDMNYLVSKYSWQRFNSSHFTKGNKVVVDNLLNNIKYKIQKQTTVFSIEDKKNHVIVSYFYKNKKYNITAKKVVVTTPSNIAKEIILKINHDTYQYLDKIKYVSYKSISFIVEKKINKNKYSYILPIDSYFSNIVLHKTIYKDKYVVQFYIPNSKISLIKDDNEIYTATKYMNQFWKISEKNILYQTEQFWHNAGVIIDSNFANIMNDNYIYASKNIYLAGDYTWLDNGNVPFGMVAAIESGIRAANLIK